jgi:hypothetical protein
MRMLVVLELPAHWQWNWRWMVWPTCLGNYARFIHPLSAGNV